MASIYLVAMTWDHRMARGHSEVQSRRDPEMHQVRSLQLIISWPVWNCTVREIKMEEVLLRLQK